MNECNTWRVFYENRKMAKSFPQMLLLLKAADCRHITLLKKCSSMNVLITYLMVASTRLSSSLVFACFRPPLYRERFKEILKMLKNLEYYFNCYLVCPWDYFVGIYKISNVQWNVYDQFISERISETQCYCVIMKL